MTCNGAPPAICPIKSFEVGGFSGAGLSWAGYVWTAGASRPSRGLFPTSLPPLPYSPADLYQALRSM